MSVARLRFWSGIILFTYVLGHFLNHALMVYSVELGLAGQKIFTAPWKTTIGLVLLCGAALLHMGLALISLARRRTMKLTKVEILQYLSGLSIPIIMAHHISLALLSNLENGTTINFFGMNLLHWVIHPSSALTTVGAIIVVWVHGCIGLHFNLRVRPFYEKWSPVLLVLAVVVPLMSIAGHISGGMATARQVPNAEQAIFILGMAGFTPEIYNWTFDRSELIEICIYGLIGFVLFFRLFRHWIAKSGPTLTLPGQRGLKVIPGATVLEILKDNDIPHASICGGRGRCTTCRVKILSGHENLSEPTGDEVAALARIDADKDIRLACQVRPENDISILPLLPVGVTMRQGRQKAHLAGYEQVVTCMFIDLRGSTTLAMERLPYDVLYILNQFFAEMSNALKESDGHYAQFNGDGLMALFGLQGKPEEAALNAWKCACDMLKRLDVLNERLAENLPFPLKIGIGIHFGVAIVGDIGPPAVRHVSAIGDTINTAARLEAMCKQMGVPFVISEAAAQKAGITPPSDCRQEVEVRGRTGTLPIYTLSGELAHELMETSNSA